MGEGRFSKTMSNQMKIIAIVGTYRKGGVIDCTVDEILAAAVEDGAETEKIYLLDKHIEFCTNCRQCTQKDGPARGECPINDDMNAILDSIERSDAIVLASPMNFWTVTAIMKRFIERLVCYAYWPWGKTGPKMRNTRKDKRAVVVFSSAAPTIFTRLFTRITGLLKTAVGLLGARTIGVLSIGFAAGQPNQKISQRTKTKARKLGKTLAEK
jgi:multimeric flavodoxin WrbA